MMTKLARGLSVLFLLTVGANPVSAADRLIGVQSARVMSQSMPWIAEETGIFRKYNLEFPLVDIGAAQLLIDGGVGLVRTVVGGDADLVFIAGIKNQTPPPPSRDVAGGLNQKLPFCRPVSL